MLRFNFILAALVSLGLSQEEDVIIFPHDLHIEDIGVECEECHVDVELSTSISDRLLPKEETCFSCHDGEEATNDCAVCHTNKEAPGTYTPLFLNGRPDFSHEGHIPRFSDCTVCHGGIEADDGTEASFIWKEKDCEACHISYTPLSHNVDWKKAHGIELNPAISENCSFCHDNSFCDDCHMYQQFTPEVHPSTYLMRHGWDATTGLQECSTCHDNERDCISCHHQEKVMPMNHNFPNWSGILMNNGGEHGEAAKDSPELCQTCHRPSGDESCLRCHGD